jgi:hypothetical protein
MKREPLFNLNSNEQVVSRKSSGALVLKGKSVAIQPSPNAADMIAYWNLLSATVTNKLIHFKTTNAKNVLKTAPIVIKALRQMEDGQFFLDKNIIIPNAYYKGPKVALKALKRPITVPGFKKILDAYLERINRTRNISLYHFLFGNAFGPPNAQFGSPFVYCLNLLLNEIKQPKRNYHNVGEFTDEYEWVYSFLEEMVGYDWPEKLDGLIKEDFAEMFYAKQSKLINEDELPYIEQEPSKWIMHDSFIEALKKSWGDKEIPIFYFLSQSFFDFLNRFVEKSDY